MKKIILLTGFLFLFCYIHAQEVTRGQLMQLFYSAQKYQKAGNNEGAIQSYHKITELAPKLPEPYLALGFLYSTNDDDKSMKLALQSYRKYIELAPHNVERDSIARIVSALEQYIGAPENNIDNDTVIESITENIPENNKSNYNPPEPIVSKPEIANQKEKSIFDGKWISDRFVQSTMIPEWVFDISGSDNAYKISFHHASQRYSDNLDAKIKSAVYVNDSCLFVRFTLSDAEKDSSPDRRETIDELTLTLLSKYELNAKCKETTKVQRFGESPMVGENVFETLFYKIPDDEDMTFIMLGKDSYLITNYPATDEHPYKTTKSLIRDYKKQAKKQISGTIPDKDLYNHLAGIDSLGYCEWYSKKEAKNLLKTIGKGLVDVASATVSAITTNHFSVVSTFGGMVVQWLKESSSPASAANSPPATNNNTNNTIKINPSEWNTKMYKSLFDYYRNNKNVNIQTAY